jgi:hypothetical protein
MNSVQTLKAEKEADIELVNSGEEFFVPAQLFGLLCHKLVSDPIRKGAFGLLSSYGARFSPWVLLC